MRKLSSFWNVHRGEKIVVCGCGTSLNDLSRPERFVTIGVNDVGRLFQPTYLVVVDPRERFKNNRFEFVETSQAKYLFTQLTDPGVAHPNIVNFRLGAKNGTDFSDRNVLHYSVITPYVALYLAAFMGASAVGLIGVDFTDNHFFGNTGTHEWSPYLASIDEHFHRLGASLLTRGIKVFNLSRTSGLTAFPKMPLEAFSELRPEMVRSHRRRSVRRIVSYSTGKNDGVAHGLTRYINACTPHYSRCVSSGCVPQSSGQCGDLDLEHAPANTIAELEAADVLVLHEGRVAEQHRHFLETKTVINLEGKMAGIMSLETAKAALPPTSVDALPQLASDALVGAYCECGFDLQAAWNSINREMVRKKRSAKKGRPSLREYSFQSTPQTVSVVVVTLNEGEYLRRTVDSFLASLPAGGQIIVVDDGSTDGSADFLRHGYHGVILLRPTERLGVAQARNFGARHARGSVLVFSDAHVALPSQWCSLIVEQLSRKTVGALGPAIRVMRYPDDYLSDTGNQNTEARGYGQSWRDASLNVKWLPRKSSTPYPVPLLGGGFIAMRQEVFFAVGGFDSKMSIWGSEDSELSLRLWTLGYECLVLPEVEVAHRFRRERPYPVDWETVLYNRLRLATVHFDTARKECVVENLKQHAALPIALARLEDSDAQARRAHIHSRRQYDDDWFCRTFQSELPAELTRISSANEAQVVAPAQTL